MPLQTIVKDETYAHLVSGKFYIVIAVEDGFVRYERDTDGKAFQLYEGAFKAKFRELTEDEKSNQENNEQGVGIVVEPTEHDTLARLVLPPHVLKSALDGIRLVSIREQLDTVWELSTIMPMKGRCVMNFFGPPGTGKTALVKALARELNKKIYQVDYAAIISKWVGDTAKHIKAAFAAAKELDAILYFDEGDTLLSRRITDMSESFAASVNQNRSVLMQELDRHDGVVLVSTNLIRNYDEAILRRIIKHVEFPLPDEVARLKIFRLHFPRLDQVSITDEEWFKLADFSETLSGGDILNCAVNAMLAASQSGDPSEWKVTYEHVLSEVVNARRVKAEHSKGAPKAKATKAAVHDEN